MEPLKLEACRLLKASLAQSTSGSYTRAVVKLIIFRAKLDLGANWPVSSSQVVAFLAYLSIQGFAPSTIFAQLSAIAFVHKINGWEDPTECFIIRIMREGARRLNSSADLRRPITFPILKQLIEVLPSYCKSSYEVLLFRAAFTLAFFGFLRVGEFACTSKCSDASRVIAIDDLSFLSKDQLVVIIRYSKTDQAGKSSSLTLDSSSDALWCPVSSMKFFFGM
jgi:hypothetical protein